MRGVQGQLVLLPLFNEESTILSVLTELRRYYSGAVLVVDDGSTDGSLGLLYERQREDERLVVITHERNRGYGASLIEGFRYALESGRRAVVTMDCDFQHEPSLVPEFFKRLAGSDVLSGSRYLAESAADDPAPVDRLQINWQITERINSLTGYGLTDAFCGFKAYSTAALARLDLDEPGYGFPLQFWLRAYRAGLTVREMAVTRIYRNLNRSFGGGLDNPMERLAYYERIIGRETAQWTER